MNEPSLKGIPTRIVDTHQHVFWNGRDDLGLIADLDEHGIEYAWLLSWEIAPWENPFSKQGILNPLHLRPDGTHAGIPLSDLLLARDRFPSRFVLGYCPHPLLGNAPELLRAAADMYGVKICGEWKFRMLLDDPRCLELFRVAGDLGMPVVLHLDAPFLPDESGKAAYQPDWYGGTVENLERALQACPETIFIGHAPGFWREISGDADRSGEIYPKGAVEPGGRLENLLNSYPNLHADLSADSGLTALSRDSDYAKRFLSKFSRRLLFARDYYGGALHEFLTSLELTDETRESIYYANAERILPKPL